MLVRRIQAQGLHKNDNHHSGSYWQYFDMIHWDKGSSALWVEVEQVGYFLNALRRTHLEVRGAREAGEGPGGPSPMWESWSHQNADHRSAP